MKALIIENIQVDFAPGGAFEDVDRTMSLDELNDLMSQFDLVVLTQTSYPALPQSFAANHPWRKPEQTIEIDGLPQTLRIMHCVEGSFGSLIISDLNQSLVQHTILKGTDPNIDVDNAFYDFGNQRDTGLDALLKQYQITDVRIEGWTESVAKSRRVAIHKGYNLINA